jgi:hypothetical protein
MLTLSLRDNLTIGCYEKKRIEIIRQDNRIDRDKKKEKV